MFDVSSAQAHKHTFPLNVPRETIHRQLQKHNSQYWIGALSITIPGFTSVTNTNRSNTYTSRSANTRQILGRAILLFSVRLQKNTWSPLLVQDVMSHPRLLRLILTEWKMLYKNDVCRRCGVSNVCHHFICQLQTAHNLFYLIYNLSTITGYSTSPVNFLYGANDFK